MSLDIREGDLLVSSSLELPILFCGPWKSKRGQTAAHLKMCSETYSTKRPPQGIVRGDPVVKLLGLSGMPLDPVSQQEIDVRSLPAAPRVLKRTIIDGGDTFYEIFVEVLKKAP